MSYDVYWVKNRAEKIADFEHPTFRVQIYIIYLILHPKGYSFFVFLLILNQSLEKLLV